MTDGSVTVVCGNGHHWTLWTTLIRQVMYWLVLGVIMKSDYDQATQIVLELSVSLCKLLYRIMCCLDW